MTKVELITATTAQLQELISEGLKQQLTLLKQELKVKEEEKLLTRAETATLLSINKSTLSKWTSQGDLQSYGLGGRVYYKRSEIEEALIKLS